MRKDTQEKQYKSKEKRARTPVKLAKHLEHINQWH